MIFRSNSHRATGRLKFIYPNAIAYYNMENLLHDKAKGYYFIPDNEISLIEQVMKVKGISKARNQNIRNYGLCW